MVERYKPCVAPEFDPATTARVGSGEYSGGPGCCSFPTQTQANPGPGSAGVVGVEGAVGRGRGADGADVDRRGCGRALRLLLVHQLEPLDDLEGGRGEGTP